MLNNPRSGTHATAEYISPGLPWVLTQVYPTTPVLVDLPKVTRAFTVRNLDTTNDLKLGFTENGIEGSNYFEIPAGSSERFELRVHQIYIQASSAPLSCSLMAELTTIDRSQFTIFTGSSDSAYGAGAGWQGVG